VPLDPVTAFGVASLSTMLVSYALEDRGRRWVLVFALACWASAAYGWMAGAWPFTVVEGVWGVVALRRYLRRT
jgi:hypothetical protein